MTFQIPDCGSLGNKPARRHRAFIVLIVMVVIVMISLAGLSFVLNLSTENKAVHVQGTQLQLKQTLASGVELLRGLLDQPPAERELSGGLLDNRQVLSGVEVTEAGSLLGATGFAVVSPAADGDRAGGLRHGLQNESARLNLGVLLDWERDHPGAAAAALMNLPGMTEATADAILDWIDPDDVARPAGAEDAYYAGRGLPYGPRNGVPAALEELLLVRDVARTSLFGADTDVNYRIDAREAQMADGASAGAGDATPWAWLLTVHSGERNQTYDGQPRIDLNDADLGRLHAALSDAFDSMSADFVIAYRQFGPHDPSHLPRPARPDTGTSRTGRERGRRTSGRSDSASGRAATRSRSGNDGQAAIALDLSLPAAFEIGSVLDLAEIQVAAPAEADRGGEDEDALILMDSPFGQAMDGLRDHLPRWMDLTTTTREPVLRGQVNINQASRYVLLGIPGLDPSLVDRIISARPAATDAPDPTRRHPTWLLTEGLVDLDQMRQLLPYISCGGDVFRGQVVAFDRDSGLSARAEVVLDATVSPPRQVYWKDLGLLGRGFAPQELGAGDAAGSNRGREAATAW